MLNYKIRELENKEILKAIKVLYTSFGRATPPNIKEEEKVWKALIDSRIGTFLIAEKIGKVFGVGGVFLFEKVSTFGYMAVLPEYRGKGVGTEIFRNLVKIANEKNCETMILYPSMLGKKIYEKFGFQERFYGTMYQLSAQISDIGNKNKKVHLLRKIPEWGLILDEKAMGFNRRRYLNLKVEMGARILAIENEGYGLLVGKRLGPLIANNSNAAILIIKKSICLGANHIIITSHDFFPKTIIKSLKLKKKDDGASLKMVLGKELSENLDLLYTIGTYAKG